MASLDESNYPEIAEVLTKAAATDEFDPVCPGCSATMSGVQLSPDYIDDFEMIEEILGK